MLWHPRPRTVSYTHLDVYKRQLYEFDGQGKYLGTAPIPQGEASLRIDIAVWRPIHSPRLVNYGDYEGMNVSEASDRLVRCV